MQINSISTFIFESYIFYQSEPDEMIKKYLPPTYPLLAILVNTVQWCRKVKNIGGARGGDNLTSPVNWSAKYWRASGPPAPPGSGITAVKDTANNKIAEKICDTS